MEQMTKPADVEGLIAAIPSREVGAQVYAAALMAISVDTDAERAFLARLAHGAGLGAGPGRGLHAMVGAPTLAAWSYKHRTAPGTTSAGPATVSGGSQPHEI